MTYFGKFLSYISQIPNVGKYVIYKGNIYTIFNEKLTLYDQNNKLITKFEFPSTTIYLTEYGVFSGKNFYINNFEVNNLENLDKKYFSGICNKNIFLFTKDDILFYDIESREVKFHFPFFSDRSIFYIGNDTFFCRGRSILSAHSINSRNEIWSIDVKKYLEKKESTIHSVYVHENVIIIKSSCNNLLFIDISSGNINSKRGFDSNLFFSCSYYKNRIHAFSYGTYYEIDIESGEILRQKSLELELQARDCSPASHTAPAVNEKYIAIAPGFRPKALLIDRERLEIVQELDLKGSYVNNSEILQFHDNRLYILDAHNTLHIFEDE